MIDMREKDSGLGIDRLRAHLVEAVDRDHSSEPPVVEDLVDAGAAGSAPTGIVDGLPDDLDGVSLDGSLAANDGAGDDPFHDDVVDVGTTADRHAPRVLDADGVDTVDDVRPVDTVLGKLGSGETGAGQDDDGDQADDAGHESESKNGLGPISKVALGLVGLIVLAVLAFTIFEPVQVLPRIRIAPGFAFVDQSDMAVTSEDGAGAVTLYSFAPTSCSEECDPIFETMGEVTRRVAAEIDLGGAEFRAVTVALDTAEPDVLASAAARSGADGESWRWVGGDSETLRSVVGGGFGVYYDASDPDGVVFDQTYVIVDGTGLIRGEYTYATLASDADRLTRHIGLLGEEIRNSDGNTALLYEAAHIFLCYP